MDNMTPDGKYLYCPSCNHSWEKGKEEVSLQGGDGTLEFSGVSTAKRVFDVLTGGRDDMTPELRSALETQLTGIIFEQWFEGFKAGQLANIVYVKEYYNDNGKTRSKSTGTTGVNEDGTGGNSEPISKGKDSSNEYKGGGAGSSNQRVRENVGGVSLEYPQHIRVPENIYAEVAELVDRIGLDLITKVDYNGRTLQPVIKTGI
jgi:hypothetical protein